MWVDIIAGTVLALVLGGAVAYIVIAKKKGKKCIGCPDDCSKCPHSCAERQSGTEKE
ncbi:MAG: FeoB-associated Cys-rich membrane protein [Clostridia bacterium]|nr:FeoB-associated Cys-rich membrane protein [Clostridia bacterium]MBR2915648.1 FeoB-associated Cys-rich membrane protein [Clostridia bacterium]